MFEIEGEHPADYPFEDFDSCAGKWQKVSCKMFPKNTYFIYF